MSLYVISDLHLSGIADKPMDVFGSRWTGYTEKILKYWNAIITDADTVVIPGDISWGISLEEALPDFELLASLPGEKIFGKGNHDYWWNTVTKMNAFFDAHGLPEGKFLFNSAFATDEFLIAGTRGWFNEDHADAAPENADYTKIVAREAARLRASLEAAERLKTPGDARETLAFFHFPPVFRGFVCRELLDVLHEYHVRRAYYGHIHGAYELPRCHTYEGISFTLASADFLSFIPLSVFPADDGSM